MEVTEAKVTETKRTAMGPIESELDLERSGARVIIIKVPTFLAESWGSAADGARLGRLSVSSDLSRGSIVLPTGETLKLERTPTVGGYTQGVVSETAGGQFAMEGTVEARFAVDIPLELQKERMRARTNEANVHTANVMAEDVKAPYRPSRPISFEPQASKADRYGRAKGDKRERMERDPLRNMLFGLFGQQAIWGLKDLQDQTNQPVNWLKEVLLEICDQNKMGPNRGKFELKPEYRIAEQSTDRDGDVKM